MFSAAITRLKYVPMRPPDSKASRSCFASMPIGSAAPHAFGFYRETGPQVRVVAGSRSPFSPYSSPLRTIPPLPEPVRRAGSAIDFRKSFIYSKTFLVRKTQIGLYNSHED